MKKISILLVSFVIGFCTTLVLGFTAVANAQDRIRPPEGATPACLARFNELNADGISLDDAAVLTNYCVDSDRTMISFYEGLYDRMNGDGGRPHFASMDEAREAFTMCRTVEVCPRDPEDPPREATPRTSSTLIVECRGACVNDPARGIVDGLRGRGWRRTAVCEEGSVPLVYSYRHAVVDGEDPERRHRADGVTLDIVYCIRTSNPAAPDVARAECEDIDLSALWASIHRLENACGEGGMRTPDDGDTSDWDLLCMRSDQVVINSTNIQALQRDLGELNDELDELRAREDARWAADCGKTNEEWTAMSEDDRLELIRGGQCDGSTTVLQSDWHLRFHLGVGLHLVGVSDPATLIAPYGVVYAELEALPSQNFGFFLRGYIGAGSLMDRIGQWNPAGTIGDSGVFGGSVGLTIRPNEFIAIDLGPTASAVFNPGGQIGADLHTWPLLQVGGEVRARVHPLAGLGARWFHVELTVGIDYTHSEVRRPNIGHFIGRDGVGGHGSVGLGFSF